MKLTGIIDKYCHVAYTLYLFIMGGWIALFNMLTSVSIVVFVTGMLLFSIPLQEMYAWFLYTWHYDEIEPPTIGGFYLALVIGVSAMILLRNIPYFALLGMNCIDGIIKIVW